MISTLTEIAAILERSCRVLVFTHIAPDGDAIGSLLGFGHLLAARGKLVSLVEADPIPAELQSLPGAAQIVAAPPAGPWDAVVALDASDTPRLGPVFDPGGFGNTPIVVIDHHITNLQFGTYNWVDPSAAATAQIVVHLADAWGIPIGEDAAVCLLTGLVTDTRGFRTSNVTVDVLGTAMRLMQSGANLAAIAAQTLDYKPLASIRLWGPVLADVRLDGDIIWTHVTLAMRRETGAENERDSGLVSFLLSAPEANISAVFTEKPDGRVEVGLRSRPGFDVASVALSLGGGGHPQASGCTIDGPLPAAEERVLALLRQVKRAEG